MKSKFTLLSALFFFIFSLTMRAQSSRLSAGVYYTPTAVFIVQPSSADGLVKNSVDVFGIDFKYRIWKRLHVRLGLEYSEQDLHSFGNHLPGFGGGAEGPALNITFEQYTVPILASWQIADGRLRWFMETGPSLSFLNSIEKDDSHFLNHIETVSTAVTFTAGTRVEYALFDRISIYAGIRGDFGLSNLMDASSRTLFTPREVRVNGVGSQFGVSYRF